MTERKYTLYMHIFPNKKVYIGQTCQSLERRWRAEGKGYYKNQVLMKNAILKYGWKNIQHKILFEKLTKDEVNFLEYLYITEIYHSNERKCGYNLQEGGTFNNVCKNRYWWNNGVKECRSIECPGEEWVKGQLPGHHKHHSVEVTIDETTYPSISEAMRELNLSKHAIKKLIGKYVLKEKPNNKKEIIIDNITYSSISEAHRILGISKRQINKIRGTYVLKGYNRDRITKQCIQVIIDGVKYKSLYRAGTELNISRRTLANRCKKFGYNLTMKQIIANK